MNTVITSRSIIIPWGGQPGEGRGRFMMKTYHHGLSSSAVPHGVRSLMIGVRKDTGLQFMIKLPAVEWIPVGITNGS